MTDPSPEPLRLFLALWPTQQVRDALQAHADAWAWPQAARRTRTERLHITLHFLGPMAADRLAELREALDVPWSGCDLVLDRPTVWPGGIAVLEATQVPAELDAFHAQLAGGLQRLQLPVETRRFRPHVTFARKGFGAKPPVQAEPVHWPGSRGYLLVRSLPGGRGYEPVQVFG
jgi:RNA 2',3'-cyclic 3'-phosphodiesterase